MKNVTLVIFSGPTKVLDTHFPAAGGGGGDDDDDDGALAH